LTTTFGIGFFGHPDLPSLSAYWRAQLSILLVTLGALILPRWFAEIRDKRRLAESALQVSERSGISSKPRACRAWRSRRWCCARINSPVGTSLTVASTLALLCEFRRADRCRPLRRSLLAEFADSCRDAADQLVAISSAPEI